MATFEQGLEEKGLLIVISGPSGVGKNTVIDALREEDSRRFHSVSMTTRKPRKGEENGVAYHFTTKERFEALIGQGEILEYDTYCGQYYGTPKAPIERLVRDRIDVLLDLTIKGAIEVKRNFPNAVTVFLTAPSEEALRERLRARGTETEEAIDSRLRAARKELMELGQFDYWVINDRVADAAADVSAIIRAEKRRVRRNFVDERGPETL